MPATTPAGSQAPRSEHPRWGWRLPWRSRVALLVLVAPAAITVAAHRGVLGGAAGPAAAYPIAPVPFTRVKLTDTFWSRRLEINRTVTIPYGFKKSEQEGRFRNFERAAQIRSGARGLKYEGHMPFDDTDVYKLIEGASYSLQSHPDPGLDHFLDGAIAKIAAAQEADGYLTTYKTIDPRMSPASWVKPGPRWEQELYGSHELYNAGHLLEAGYAHHRATGKSSLLDVGRRFADLLVRTFGPGPSQLKTPPGHQIVETGLIKLGSVTGDARYEKLARFFLDQRGNAAGHALAGRDNQDHLPVTEQSEAVGHAVRAAYMYAAMVDIATLENDARYRDAVVRIWNDVVSRKLYLTGAIGARHQAEAFGAAFELPNRTAYGETCASIANVYWNHRMFLRSGEAKYIDVLERSLYNGVIAGVSLAGDTFFYPNPLESDGRFKFNRGKLGRQPWFDCSCCPTNLARFIPVLPEYIYAVGKGVLYVNLFVDSEAKVDLGGGQVTVGQKTAYPWEGAIAIRVAPDRPRAFEIRVRIPGWARNLPVPSGLYRYAGEPAAAFTLRVNGQAVPAATAAAAIDKGYAVLSRTWAAGDVIQLVLPMPVRRVLADDRVADDRGKVALERGPLVYCAEGVDNDAAALDLVVPDQARFAIERRADLLGGVTVIRAAVTNRDGRARRLTAVPYYAWSNRGPGQMAVWFPRATATARPAAAKAATKAVPAPAAGPGSAPPEAPGAAATPAAPARP